MDALPSWSAPGFRRNRSAGPGSLHSGAIVLFATLALSESATALSQDATPPDSVPGRIGVDPEALPRPSVRARRASGPISVDGFLNEPGWTEAEIITGFVQSKPNAGYPSSEHTEIRILYDDETLYVGATLYYQDPSDITLHSLKRDFPSGEGDILGIAFDTYLDRSNAFMFGVNAGGAMVDLQTFDNGRDINFAWDGIADRAVRVHDEGWTAEIAVPFSTLRFDPNQPDRPWGLNFVRRLRHRGEDSFWAPIDRRYSLNRMSEAGTLTGLPAMSGGLNLLVKPFALTARSSGDAAVDGVATDFDAGLDVKYALSQGLALDLTYRTDFSQVEVDDEQVNLTRFSLFFPEKRDFFVENAGLFDFGDLPERGYRLGAGLEDFKLFHSRRIGLEGGRPVPVLGGGRLTGRVGDWGVGFLNMQTRGTEDMAAENFTALRLRRTVFGNFQIGGMFLNRNVTEESRGGGYNRSLGADLYARFWDRMIVQSYLAGTIDDGESGNNRAARVSVAWRDQFLNTSLMFREIGDAFRPGMGYIRREAVRHGYATVGVHHRRAESLLNELNPFLEMHYITNLASVLETRTGTAGFITTLSDGSRLTLQYDDRFERLFEPFRLLGDRVVPEGAYSFGERALDLQTSTGRVFSAMLGLSDGGYFGGTRRSLRLGAQWKANQHITMDAGVQDNRIDLGDGPFSARIYRGRVEYAYSTELFGSGFIQYNGVTDELITNIRLDYIHAPLSDLFLVYTERRNTATGGVLDRRFTVKLTRLWSF